MLSGRTKGAFGAKRADSGHSAPLAYVRFGAHRWPRGACRERCSVGRLRHSTTIADAFPCRDRTNIGSKKQCRVLSHRESHRTTHRSFTKKSHRETSAAEGSAGEERMRIRERYELAVELGWSYQNAGRKERGRILDAYCLATGYSRKHGLRVLRGTQQRRRLRRLGTRRRRYGLEFQSALKVLWEASGYICAERLRPFLSSLSALLQRHGQLHVSPEIEEQLKLASVSTVERNLRQLRRQRRELFARRLSQTKPGTLLRKEAPVVVGQWKELDRPGYLEVDSVSHSGERIVGEWIWTISATDLSTGWTERE